MKSEVFLLLASIISTIKCSALITNENYNINENPQIIDDRPFRPFSDVGAAAAPIVRDDNTTKSRVFEDTLLADGHPEFADGFDSLDNHFHELKEPDNPSKHENLGNLHPDEVYYADEDLLIIKGGGFDTPPYKEPEMNEEEEFYGNHVLGPPPNPHEEYNGNVATIVPPPQYKYSLFMPGDLTRSSSSSIKRRSNYDVPPRRQNRPIRRYDRSQESYEDTKLFQPHVSLSYQSPISYEAKHVLIPFWIIYPKNQRYSPKKQISFIEDNSINPSNEITIIEDNMITYPTHNNHAPFVETISGHTKPVSLIGDTAVNYLHPRPQVNPDAEVISPNRLHRRTRPFL